MEQLDYMDEIEKIVQEKIWQEDFEALSVAAVRLLCFELFIRLSVADGEERASHVFLTSSSHPVLLKVLNVTKDYRFSEDMQSRLLEIVAEILGDEKYLLPGLIESMQNEYPLDDQ
ncbi:MAG: hypothetical protein CMJ72_06925 [Planctomycetaceae bacterium]|nr:hypothetical protein [Planctomycetaceae bacterium]